MSSDIKETIAMQPSRILVTVLVMLAMAVPAVAGDGQQTSKQITFFVR